MNKKNYEDAMVKNNLVKNEDGNYYMFVKEKAISRICFESNENFEVICKISILDSNYKFLI